MIVDTEQIVDSFMNDKMPLTTKLDNGLLKTQLFDFLQWLQAKGITQVTTKPCTCPPQTYIEVFDGLPTGWCTNCGGKTNVQLCLARKGKKCIKPSNCKAFGCNKPM